MKNVISRKAIFLLFVAMMLALFVSFRRLGFIYFELPKVVAYHEIKRFVLYDILIILYFFTLNMILLWINVLEGLSKSIVKNIMHSFIITIALYVFSYYFLKKFTFDHKLYGELIDMYKAQYPNDPHARPISIFLIAYSCLLFVTITGSGWGYNLALKKIDVERKYEKLRIESLQNQLTALNNQINPHFFFNNLNSLYALINENQKEKSLEYLSNLSSVFRYILQSEKKGLVKLSEELDFLNIYNNLLVIKFDNRLLFQSDIDKKYNDYRLPILSFLPIIENVIKHNEISYKHQMAISIHIASDDYITIRNTKKQRLDIVESGGVGLRNLNNRFKLLTGKEIRIENTEHQFSISLPLVNV